jgi:branched-chain amino acid transport system permease protein
MSALTDDTLPVTPRAMRDEMIVFAAMAVLLGMVPLTGIYPFFVMQALCFALLACAFNLLIGYGGLLSFGHAMFLGTAGYCTAHALKVWGVSPELGILVGVAGAAALSVITGFISIRRQGIYFSMITLALSQLLFFIYLQAPFTHGEDGIQGIPQGYLFGIFNLAKPTVLYYVVLGGFLGGFLLIYRTINSPFGEVLKAIRENEPRAISLGYKTDHYKLLAFILSGTLAGFAGSLKVFVAQNASLTDVRRNRADDAGRWPRHGLWSGRRRLRDHRHAAIPGRVRAVGDGDPGRHLRRLRADLPPRGDRRDRALFPPIPVKSPVLPQFSTPQSSG